MKGITLLKDAVHPVPARDGRHAVVQLLGEVGHDGGDAKEGGGGAVGQDAQGAEGGLDRASWGRGRGGLADWLDGFLQRHGMAGRNGEEIFMYIAIAKLFFDESSITEK